MINERGFSIRFRQILDEVGMVCGWVGKMHNVIQFFGSGFVV
jgi:hypothetical protein